MEPKQSIFKIVSGVGLTFIFLFFVYKLLNVGAEKIYQDINVIKSSDHARWSQTKKNLLVEYSDFQCPACRNVHLLLKSFESTKSAHFDLTKKITFVFRNFPLYQIHSDAFDSAYAAEAAGAQGKYFEMADLLFEKQEEWVGKTDAKTYFIKYAQSLKLNLNQFQQDMESQKIKDKVRADLTQGEEAQINETPTFFLNGKKLQFQSPEEFIKILQKTSN